MKLTSAGGSNLTFSTNVSYHMISFFLIVPDVSNRSLRVFLSPLPTPLLASLPVMSLSQTVLSTSSTTSCLTRRPTRPRLRPPSALQPLFKALRLLFKVAQSPLQRLPPPGDLVGSTKLTASSLLSRSLDLVLCLLKKLA